MKTWFRGQCTKRRLQILAAVVIAGISGTASAILPAIAAAATIIFAAADGYTVGYAIPAAGPTYVGYGMDAYEAWCSTAEIEETRGDDDFMDTAPALISDILEIFPDLDIEREIQFAVVAKDPLPLTILELILELGLTER